MIFWGAYLTAPGCYEESARLINSTSWIATFTTLAAWYEWAGEKGLPDQSWRRFFAICKRLGSSVPMDLYGALLAVICLGNEFGKRIALNTF